MKHFKRFLFLVFAFVFAFSLARSVFAEDSGGVPGVYVCGYYLERGEWRACYWYLPLSRESGGNRVSGNDNRTNGSAERRRVNGIKYNLGSNGSFASSIAVADGKIYVSGGYDVAEGTRPCYWVNGIRYELPEGAARAAAITVENDVIYIAGEYERDGNAWACYFKSGSLRNFNVFDSTANAIAVENGAVYAAGQYYRSQSTTAFYWKNGEKVDLDAKCTAEAIAVENGSVFTAGRYWDGTNNTACYWGEDGVRVLFSDTMSEVPAIAVVNGELYAAVNEFTDAKPRAGYSAQGRRYEVPEENSRARAIAVSGGKIYLAGEYKSGETRRACIWIDGIKTDLSGEKATATGIFVVE